ncbi:MAG: hypothetical protein ACLVKR_08810 [Lachnospiraceae bacterium]
MVSGIFDIMSHLMSNIFQETMADHYIIEGILGSLIIALEKR